MSVRRVVTGKVGGKSKIISEGGTRRNRAFKNIPGQSAALLWSTSTAPGAPTDGADVVSETTSYVPTQPGETRLMIVTFAPDSVMMSIDPAAGFQEFAEHIPDLAAAMEPDSPGMHTTQTVDYGIVLEGEIPSPLDPPGGCTFHPRCPHCIAACRTQVPQLREVAEGHFVSCLLAP